MGKALKRWWPLFMLPTCLAFMIGFVIPFIQGFYLSFCQFITINNTHFVGIENYVRALSDPQFATSFFFTVAFAFLSTVLINVIASPLRRRSPAKRSRAPISSVRSSLCLI